MSVDQVWNYTMVLADKMRKSSKKSGKKSGGKGSKKKRSSSHGGAYAGAFGGRVPPYVTEVYVFNPKGENVKKDGELKPIKLPKDDAQYSREDPITFGYLRKKHGDIEALRIWDKRVREYGKPTKPRKRKASKKKVESSMDDWRGEWGDLEDLVKESEKEVKKIEKAEAAMEDPYASVKIVDKAEETISDSSTRLQELMEKIKEQLADYTSSEYSDDEPLGTTGMGKMKVKKILKGAVLGKGVSRRGVSRAGARAGARAGKSSKKKSSKGKKSKSYRGAALLGGKRCGDSYST